MTVYEISGAFFDIVVSGKSCYGPTVLTTRGCAMPDGAVSLSAGPRRCL